MRTRLRTAARFALAAGIAASFVPAAPASAAGPDCPSAGQSPRELSVTEVRVATLCLLNAERRAHGLAPLQHHRRLALAGTRHVRDMVGARYFAHDSRSGRRFSARIARTGYAGGRRAVFGENLAWGTGALATPRAIVRAWMQSPGHRANILRPEFREIGIAVAAGTPGHGADGATYATEFGRRW